MEAWSAAQLECFRGDGFLVVDQGCVDAETVELLRGRFEPLYAGDYATGIRPDEVNWVAGRDPEDRTRQICNGWKADPRIAAQVRSERTGRLAAELVGWDGVRLVQDTAFGSPRARSRSACTRTGATSTIWGPRRWLLAGSRSTTPRPRAARSPMRRDHTTGRARPRTAASSTRPRTGSRRSSAPARPARICGSCRSSCAQGAAFYHFNTFHGSGPNTATVHRRAVISHLGHADASFQPEHVDPVYSRYRRTGGTAMDESFVPIVWTRDGYRSAWLDRLVHDQDVAVRPA